MIPSFLPSVSKSKLYEFKEKHKANQSSQNQGTITSRRSFLKSNTFFRSLERKSKFKINDSIESGNKLYKDINSQNRDFEKPRNQIPLQQKMDKSIRKNIKLRTHIIDKKRYKHTVVIHQNNELSDLSNQKSLQELGRSQLISNQVSVLKHDMEKQYSSQSEKTSLYKYTNIMKGIKLSSQNDQDSFFQFKDNQQQLIQQICVKLCRPTQKQISIGSCQVEPEEQTQQIVNQYFPRFKSQTFLSQCKLQTKPELQKSPVRKNLLYEHYISNSKSQNYDFQSLPWNHNIFTDEMKLPSKINYKAIVKQQEERNALIRIDDAKYRVQYYQGLRRKVFKEMTKPKKIEIDL